MFIFQIDPWKILQTHNTGETSKSIDTPDTTLLKSLLANKPGSIGPELPEPILPLPPPSPFPPGGYVPPNDQIPPAMLFGEIIDLSNALLIDPYHHLNEIPKLGKALAEYTHTEYDLGKADELFNFFLRDKSDLTGDGKLDHNDVIAFWNSLKPRKKEPLPPVDPIIQGPERKVKNLINRFVQKYNSSQDITSELNALMLELKKITGLEHTSERYQNVEKALQKISKIRNWIPENPPLNHGERFYDDILKAYTLELSIV